MGSVGTPEIMVILLIGLLILGPTRLPEVARQGAKMLAEFKRMSQNVQKELRAEIKDMSAASDSSAPAAANGNSAPSSTDAPSAPTNTPEA